MKWLGVLNIAFFSLAIRALSEWRCAQSNPQMTRTSHASHNNVVVKWSPPMSGSFKCNTDVSLPVGGESSGTGIIVRDSQGRCVAGQSKFIPATADPIGRSTLFSGRTQLGKDIKLKLC